MSEQKKITTGETLTGQVIDVINDHEVVIDKGSADGVSMENRFLLYKYGDEMIDPESHENLGRLELVCGEGKPKHIQEKFTILESSKVRILRGDSVLPLLGLGLGIAFIPLAGAYLTGIIPAAGVAGTAAGVAASLLKTDAEKKTEETKIRLPFDNVEKGYLFKQIR